MSGSVPKTPARRAAMSGDTGTRPFTIADTCLRLTPRASAVCVNVTRWFSSTQTEYRRRSTAPNVLKQIFLTADLTVDLEAQRQMHMRVQWLACVGDDRGRVLSDARFRQVVVRKRCQVMRLPGLSGPYAIKRPDSTVILTV